MAPTDDSAQFPERTPTGAGYPVAPIDGDGTNTIHIATWEVEIWLLDHGGQRMGADTQAEDPIDQAKGAFYRLALDSGEVRFGHADKDGLVTEYDVEALRSATLQWGEPDSSDGDDAVRPSLDASDDDWGAYLLYKQKIAFEAAPWETGAESDRHLGNLGYGDFDDPRGAFGNDYGASDDDLIASVHDQGTARSG